MRMLWVGLRLAIDMLGLELPAAIEERVLSQSLIADVARQLRLGVFDPEEKPFGSVEMTRLQLKMRERSKDRLNYCFRLIVMTKLIDSLCSCRWVDRAKTNSAINRNARRAKVTQTVSCKLTACIKRTPASAGPRD